VTLALVPPILYVRLYVRTQIPEECDADMWKTRPYGWFGRPKKTKSEHLWKRDKPHQKLLVERIPLSLPNLCPTRRTSLVQALEKREVPLNEVCDEDLPSAG
jgi:hypothetical protein